MKCDCGNEKFMDKGRAADGRRAYRCQVCLKVWTEGLQGREKKFSAQRPGYQFFNTGASKKEPAYDEKDVFLFPLEN